MGWGLGLAAAGLVLAGVAAVVLPFRATVQADRARVEGRATLLASPFGNLEYLVGGGAEADADAGDPGAPPAPSGAATPAPWVFLVHGAGGGYDMGELMAEILLGDGFRWIAPSRFGYLGSSVSGDATPDTQADAYAWLLDELGIQEVAVVALSAGGPSALLFALRHPERVRSLTLVSAGVTRVGASEQEAADWKGRMLVRLFSRDFPYWAATSLFERRFLELLGVDREVARALTPEEGAWVRRLLEGMRPASLRARGAAFDNLAPLPGARIAGITAPTLVIHAEDDRLQLFENARFAEATIPRARLVAFARGGHLVAITRQADVREAVRGHVLGHQGAAAHESASNPALDPGQTQASNPALNPTEDP